MHNFRKEPSADSTDNGVEKNDYPRATSEYISKKCMNSLTTPITHYLFKLPTLF